MPATLRAMSAIMVKVVTAMNVSAAMAGPARSVEARAATSHMGRLRIAQVDRRPPTRQTCPGAAGNRRHRCGDAFGDAVRRTVSTGYLLLSGPHTTADVVKLTGNVVFHIRSYWKYASFSCMEYAVPEVG